MHTSFASAVRNRHSKAAPIHVAVVHLHIKMYTQRHTEHVCTHGATHPASRREPLCAARGHLASWLQTNCNNTTRYSGSSVRWKMSRLVSSQHTAPPPNVSTSSCSRYVCPFLTMWSFLSLIYYTPFFFSPFCSCHFALSLLPQLGDLSQEPDDRIRRGFFY